MRGYKTTGAFVTVVGAYTALAVAAATLAAQEESLPTGSQVLDRYIEVTGGRAAYAKLNNMIVETSIKIPAMGMEMSGTKYLVAPDKMIQKFESNMMGNSSSGSDGEIVWFAGATGARLLKGFEKQQVMRQATFNPELNWKKLFTTAKCLTTEEVNGEMCYRVVMISIHSDTEVRFYSVDSGLLLKTDFSHRGQKTGPTLKSVFSDYKKVGDILTPHTTKLSRTGQETVITVDSIKYNSEMPEDAFAMPEAIQKLVDQEVSAPVPGSAAALPNKP